MCKPRESCSVQVNSQRLVRCTQSVDTHIKLATPEKQGVQEILLADVVLNTRVPGGGFPFGNIVDILEDKNALALTLRGLHYRIKIQVS